MNISIKSIHDGFTIVPAPRNHIVSARIPVGFVDGFSYFKSQVVFSPVFITYSIFIGVAHRNYAELIICEQRQQLPDALRTGANVSQGNLVAWGNIFFAAQHMPWQRSEE